VHQSVHYSRLIYRPTVHVPTREAAESDTEVLKGA
jgi:hypothetical protein